MKKKQSENQENNNDDEWEDVEDEIDDQEFVEVLSRNKKKNLVQKNNLNPPNRLQCGKCEQTFDTDSNLDIYMKMIRRDKVPIKCILCPFRSQSKTQFFLHMETHSQSPNTTKNNGEGDKKRRVIANISYKEDVDLEATVLTSTQVFLNANSEVDVLLGQHVNSLTLKFVTRTVEIKDVHWSILKDLF